MEPVVGVICEYDPFHRGHARQLALIRERLPGARVVCLMSGCFTQRGGAALFSPGFRAERALRAGADLVLELPCVCAVRDAENFALGGVRILDALGFITHLSFGAEHAASPLLPAAASLLERPTDEYRSMIRAKLDQGRSLAEARGAALGECLPGTDAQAIFSSPNDLLGLCYLRALTRLHSALQPLPVERAGDYHADTLSGAWPSAGAIRAAYLAGDLTAAEAACGYPLGNEAAHRPNALDTALLDRLRQTPPEAFAALPDCTEGLENRLHAAAREATTRDQLLILLKTRRYPYARLNRLVTHALLGLTAELARQAPGYARLLGLRADSPLTPLLRQSRVRVIAKAADGDFTDPLYRLDERAYDLWALGAGLPAGLMARQRVRRV